MQVDICMLNLLNSPANGYSLPGDSFYNHVFHKQRQSFFPLQYSAIHSNQHLQHNVTRRGDGGHLTFLPDLMVQTSKILL